MSEKITFEEQLKKTGKLVYTNKGVSMLPLLRENRDIMVIESIRGEQCHKYDAVLFIRPHVTGRGRYVLHRILRENPDGSFWIVGDHCTSGEAVRPENIIGILTAVHRDKNVIAVTDLRYRIYVHLWCDFYPLRFWLLRVGRYPRRCLALLRRLAEKL